MHVCCSLLRDALCPCVDKGGCLIKHAAMLLGAMLTGQGMPCVQACKPPALMRDLTNVNHQILDIQAGLTDFLETKRKVFVRFHYLSPEAMFQILGGIEADLDAIQPHLMRLFGGRLLQPLHPEL